MIQWMPPLPPHGLDPDEEQRQLALIGQYTAMIVDLKHKRAVCEAIEVQPDPQDIERDKQRVAMNRELITELLRLRHKAAVKLNIGDRFPPTLN